jgi:hypothetical protein
MSTTLISDSRERWKDWQVFLLRLVFLYFLVQIIPIDRKFYGGLAEAGAGKFSAGDIFNLAHYTPQFTGGQSFVNWFIAIGIALMLTAVWYRLQRRFPSDNDRIYYWFRVVLRYRLALALLVYGFIKLFPIQAPLPSISNLNTHYGDFNRWKLFSLSLGIVPSYESFLGGVEILLALGLIYRKTASLSAFIVIVFTGNVFMSNIAYDGGELVYSFFLLSLAFFILLYDARRLIRLLVAQLPTSPDKFYPRFNNNWRYGRLIARAAFVFVFVGLYGFSTFRTYKSGAYQYPAATGLKKLAGLYNVSRFVLNRDTIEYSLTDPKRWRDVVFETWNTISIRTNFPAKIDSSNTDVFHHEDRVRNYEFAGSSGRLYYSYTVDTVKQLLSLVNRNKDYPNDFLKLKYSVSGDSAIVLSGVDQHNDSLTVVLNRINKKYLLKEVAEKGRRKSFKL